MKTTILCLLLFTGIFHSSFCQDVKVKFGKINPADLAMKSYAPDSDAVAVVLSKIGLIRYDLRDEKYALHEDKHVVIKILTEAGIDQYGNAELSYYAFDDYSKIANIRAMVHLPDGTEIKVDNSQILAEKTNDYWSTEKIIFPKLVPGAIIEYEYTLLSSGMFHPVDWFFQAEIPIVYAELRTEIPEWFEFVILNQGSPLDHKESQIINEQISVSTTERAATGRDRVQTTLNTVEVRVVVNEYINKDVPALKEECCITTMEDYFSRVRYQLKAYQFPNSSREPVMNSWKKLADELYEMGEWGGQIRNQRPGQLVLEAAGITTSDSALQIETARKIYNYINANIEWNNVYSISTQKDINSILKARTGSSGDLNKLMCAALRQAGIQATPVLVSTRDHGKALELYPFTDQFNHMVVFARIDNKDVWIDLGNKHRPIGLLRVNSLNSRGWVVDAMEPVWTDILPAESKSIYLIKGALDADGNIDGNLECRFTGYHAVENRVAAGDDKEKFVNELILNGNLPVPLSGLEMTNLDDPYLPLQIKTTIDHHQMGTATPDKVYLNSMIPKGLDENLFKLEARDYPISMNYPEEVNVILNLALPEGFTVESLPQPVRYVTENGGIQVTYDATFTSGKLNVTMKYILKRLLFEPEEYATLKSIFNERKQKFNEQIVLAKA